MRKILKTIFGRSRYIGVDLNPPGSPLWANVLKRPSFLIPIFVAAGLNLSLEKGERMEIKLPASIALVCFMQIAGAVRRDSLNGKFGDNGAKIDREPSKNDTPTSHDDMAEAIYIRDDDAGFSVALTAGAAGLIGMSVLLRENYNAVSVMTAFSLPHVIDRAQIAYNYWNVTNGNYRITREPKQG